MNHIRQDGFDQPLAVILRRLLSVLDESGNQEARKKSAEICEICGHTLTLR